MKPQYNNSYRARCYTGQRDKIIKLATVSKIGESEYLRRLADYAIKNKLKF